MSLPGWMEPVLVAEEMRGVDKWAIEMWDGCREMARRDPDFDAVRDEPRFRELLGG